MKYALPIALLTFVAFPVIALDGTVINEKGLPIAGAKVNADNSKKDVITDEQGRFSFKNDPTEIHVTSPGFSHKTLHLHDQKNENITVTLKTSVIDQVDVIGLPIHASIIESAVPVAVLSGEALRNQQAATLGDSLDKQPGVNSNFHGNVASTPVIRGLSGPRVLITQNSLDVSDASRVGPDHSVASEISTASQVEVFRGPATLFYGSGAFGGVVNVVDKRVPTDTQTRREFMLSRESVNNQNLGSFNVSTGTDLGENSVAFYADGFWREADDYEVPVAPEEEHDDDHDDEHSEDEHGNDKTVANSAEESKGFTLGTSYILDNGYVGISAGRLEREYGIPGHGHGGEEDGHEEDEDHEEGEEEEHGHEEGEEEIVFADLKQDRFQLLSEIELDSPWLRAIHTRAAYTDYTHTEFEDGIAGTMFSNKTSEIRVDLFHQEVDHWSGGFNLHYKNSEFSAQGEEAFTPPSTSETLAIAFMEERHIGNLLIQLGARVENVAINADNVLFPSLEFHDHDEGHEEDDDEEHEESHEGATTVFTYNETFTPVSLSLGAVWDFKPGYNLGISLSRSERAPSAAELLSFGPHIGTRSYEIGSLFALHEEGEENGEHEEAHFERSDTNGELETSHNIDLTFRKHEGNVGIILNAFFNKIDDYYYQSATGLFAESGHEHEEEHDDEGHDEGEEHAEEGEHEDELPVFLFKHDNAELYGFEAQGIWKLNDHWKTTLFTDYVHAELTDGTYLPRTPPLRYGAELDYKSDQISANISWTRYATQNKAAPLETSTSGYNMLDATATYYLPIGSNELALFLKAENITDTEARVHTSFIKDIAPRPGRNFTLGLRAIF